MPDLGWVKEYVPDPESLERLSRQIRRFKDKLKIPSFDFSRKVNNTD